MKPKNSKLKIGNILSEHKFISGTMYWRIDSVTMDGKLFTVGTKVSWIDLDSPRLKKCKGTIDWLMIDEQGNVQVSTDNMDWGRLGIEHITKI